MTDATNPASPSHPPAPHAACPPIGISAAERLLAEQRAEIGRADTKASVLIGALGACAGAVLSSYWSRVPTTGFSRSLGLTTALAWSLALGFLLFAMAPRYRASQWQAGRPLTYFLDIRRAAGTGVLTDALRTTEEEALTGLVIALRDTSEIVAAKHRWIRTGLLCFSLGALTLGGSALAAV